jgi:hypothetical protein
MSTQWISEVPDMRADSGLNIRMAIDSAANLHVAYLVNHQLTYAISNPGPPALLFTGGMPLIRQTYQWTRHDNVLPSSEWGIPSPPFDLAVDSNNRAHLCFQGIEMTDHMMLGDLQHAVWDGSQFVSADVLPANNPSISLSGLAMTIAKDDSVHIAFAPSHNQAGLWYATRANSSAAFQRVEVDSQAGSITNLSIAVGSSGQVGISYILDLTGHDPSLMYAEKTSSGWLLDTAVPAPLTFGTNTWAIGLALPNMGTSSLVIDAGGVPHIAFFNDGPGGPGIRHVTWTSAGRHFWTLSGFGELVDAMGLPSTAKILLDKNNALHIAYQAMPGPGSNSSQLRFATRTIAGWAPATVDASTNSGWSISAAIDPKNVEPHIVYGFEFSGFGAFLLKHTWAVDMARLPFPPPKHPRRKILQRPD